MHPESAKGAPTRNLVGTALTLLTLWCWSESEVLAAQVPDTVRCNARVVVRDATTGKPLPGVYVSVAPISRRGAPAGSEQDAFSDVDGIAEFAALPACRYDVMLDGVLGHRIVGASIPAAHLNAVPVGDEPGKVHSEIRRFRGRRNWTVSRGDCSDSLVARVGPVPWRKTEPREQWRANPATTRVGWPSAPRSAAKPTSAALLVRALDDSTGIGIRNVDVSLRRSGYYVSDTHWEPMWQAFTDIFGQVWLTGIPKGAYTLSLCSNTYEPERLEIRKDSGSIDTVSVGLRFVGPPSDGRRCELRIQVDGFDATTGKVTILASERETGRPIAFCTVTVVGEHRGAMTDKGGLATMALEPGLKKLKFDTPGRLSRTDTVRVIIGRTTTLRIRLDPDPQGLEY